MSKGKREIPPLRQAFIKHLIADPEMCGLRAYKAAGYTCKNNNVGLIPGFRYANRISTTIDKVSSTPDGLIP